MQTLIDFGKLFPEFVAHSRVYQDYDGPLFTSAELGHYQVSPAFSDAKTGLQIPDTISRRLGAHKKSSAYVGAYQPLP